MIGRWREALRNHWQAWTCLHGWSRLICIADDVAHMLHLPMRWLCDLHDGRLMRTMGDECVNDLHDSSLRRMWEAGEPVELDPRPPRGGVIATPEGDLIPYRIEGCRHMSHEEAAVFWSNQDLPAPPQRRGNVTRQFRCDHMTASGLGLLSSTCPFCGPMRRVPA